jgi:hypothetical protein
MSRLPSFYSLSLMIGALLVGIAGLRHPMLEGDGAAQLSAIAAADHWRAIHLSLVFGMVLVAAGLIGIALLHGDTPGSSMGRAGILLVVLGYGIALIGVLFMTGTAPRIAAAYERADPGLVATEAVFAYDMLRPFATIALRAGEFAIGLATWCLGWAMLDGRLAPRWLGMLGVAAGVVCAVWAVLTNEESGVLMAGLGPVTIWHLLTGIWLAARERSRQLAA